MKNVYITQDGIVGLGNIGYGNVGYGNIGYGNIGYGNIGYGNIGYDNVNTEDTYNSSNVALNLLNNEDLIHLLEIQSINKPLHKRLEDDFMRPSKQITIDINARFIPNLNNKHNTKRYKQPSQRMKKKSIKTPLKKTLKTPLKKTLKTPPKNSMNNNMYNDYLKYVNDQSNTQYKL
jgi:PPE-repeat protein